MSVEPICVGDVQLKPLGDGCEITFVPPDTVDRHQRRWVRIARIETSHGYCPIAHYNCLHNQIAALHNRVLAAVPQPTEEGLRKLRKTTAKICRLLPTTPTADWYDMPKHYSGQKRQRYERAVDDVLARGYSKKDARVKMFVKFEKLTGLKVNPDPRAIQFRHPRYCVALGRFLKPMEEVLYRLCGDGIFLPSTRVIGKGLSMDGRAKLLHGKMSTFERPCVVSLDASRFDLHVALELLRLEHSVYMAMNSDPELALLLSWQLHNEGVSDLGIKYKCKGRRMSGDMNTALGNCLLMVIMVATFMEGRKYDILDDGDDCLLITEESELEWVLATAKDAFLSYGMEIKVENVAHFLEEVEWCQCRPIRVDHDTIRFVRNPHKVLSTALSGTKYFTQEGARRKLVNTIGMAELVLNLGVPVLQEYALALMRNAATSKILSLEHLESYSHRLRRELAERNMRQLKRVNPVPITSVARYSFMLAYNMSADDQVELEHFLRKWSFTFADTQQLTAEMDVAQWERLHHFTPELHCVGDDDQNKQQASFHSTC